MIESTLRRFVVRNQKVAAFEQKDTPIATFRTERPDSTDPMRVLNLTNADVTFYRHQLRALKAQGVASTTIEVPGRDGRGDRRSVVDYLRFWPDVYKEIDETYDLVHANFGLTAPMALTQRKLPVVMSLWGTDLHGPFGWVSKAAAPFCDAVIVMSKEMNDEIPRDCDVIPHGIDLDRFYPEPTEAAQKAVGWDDDSYHVLFPYRTEREVKDHPRARRIVSAVDDTLARSVTLEVVTGVPQEKFVTYMNAADSLLLTSKREGSPNVVKEAMACNLPVVSTDVGDVRERLEDVEPSFVGKTDGELIDALSDVLQENARSNGREIVQKQGLSLERMGEQIVSVYERVLDQSG